MSVPLARAGLPQGLGVFRPPRLVVELFEVCPQPPVVVALVRLPRVVIIDATAPATGRVFATLPLYPLATPPTHVGSPFAAPCGIACSTYTTPTTVRYPKLTPFSLPTSERSECVSPTERQRGREPAYRGFRLTPLVVVLFV
jgi:hypothetical protein